MNTSLKLAVYLPLILLLLISSCCECSPPKDRMTGHWQQTYASGVRPDWIDVYDFSDSNRYRNISSCTGKENEPFAVLSNGQFVIRKDSLYLYDEGQPEEIRSRGRMVFYSDTTMVFKTPGRTTYLSKRKS